MKKSKFVKALFTIDEDITFEGVHNPRETWNGFAVPYFDWKNARKIARWVNRLQKRFKLESYAVIKEKTREIYLTEDGETEIYKGPRYAIGGWSWCWSVTCRIKNCKKCEEGH